MLYFLYTLAQPVSIATIEQPVSIATIEQPASIATIEKPVSIATIEKPVSIATIEQPVTIATIEQSDGLSVHYIPHTSGKDCPSKLNGFNRFSFKPEIMKPMNSP